MTANLPYCKGSPAIWSPPANCPRIEPDKGEIFIDQNTALYSSFPLEPMFRAIYEVHPELDLEEVDVVICRNTMGKLFDFVMNYSKNFEIDVEIVGNKAIFVRKEKKTTGFMNFQGFGHTFPKEYTRWDSAVKGSTSHHRVAEYEFAGLKYLVRFSSDGYLAENAGHQKVSSPRQSIADPVSTTKLLSSGGFPMISEKRPITGHELVVRNGGIEVDQAATIKIKTQGIHSRVDIESVLPRLWMSQTPNLIVAYHKNGRFEDVQILDMRKHLAKWEEANSLNLRKLNAIIRQIIDTVQNTISRKCRIKRTDNKELEIWELDISHQSALPADLCRKLGGKDLEDEDERSKHTGQVNFARDLWEDDDDDDLKDDYGYSDTDESIKDYTACSSEHCGNCGHCDY